MRSDSPATMQFEYDPELLIEEVKKRPGIWDFEDVNYRSMATRLELWNEVVRELLQPNVKVSKTEMRELVLQLQKKWKSVKDSFHKYIQNPNRTKRPYIYCKQLNFMLKNDTNNEYGGTAAGASSGSEDAPLAKKKKVWKPKRQRQLHVKHEASTDEDDHVQYVEVEPYSNDEAEKTTSKLNNTKTVDEFAFASVTSIDSGHSSTDDCDKMFLLSLLPHLKSIPEECRLNTKMELLRVLRNANHSFDANAHLIA